MSLSQMSAQSHTGRKLERADVALGCLAIPHVHRLPMLVVLCGRPERHATVLASKGLLVCVYALVLVPEVRREEALVTLAALVLSLLVKVPFPVSGQRAGMRKGVPTDVAIELAHQTLRLLRRVQLHVRLVDHLVGQLAPTHATPGVINRKGINYSNNRLILTYKMFQKSI